MPPFDDTAYTYRIPVPDAAVREWLELAAALDECGPAPCERGDPEAWWPSLIITSRCVPLWKAARWLLRGQAYPVGRHQGVVGAGPPVVLLGPADVGHPAAGVVAEPPGALVSDVPPPVVLHLDAAGRVEEVLLEDGRAPHARRAG